MRVVTGGVPSIPGENVLGKVQYLREHLDNLRSFITMEPRGHAGMFAAILTEPCESSCHFGVVFLNPGGYDTMCGHGTIAICTVLVETGMIEVQEPTTTILLDTPAGIVEGVVAVQDGCAESVTLRNVPSFLLESDVEVTVPEMGDLRISVAYGGDLFYAILPAESVGLELAPEWDSRIVSIGRSIWDAIGTQVEVRHPELPQIKGFAGVIFSGPPTHPEATMKNACFGPPGFTDRSPCGTGTCAKMAELYGKGELGLNEDFVHESVIGTIFRGRAVEEVHVGPYKAIVPLVSGSAYVTGFQQLVLDSRDPFPDGFCMGRPSEIW